MGGSGRTEEVGGQVEVGGHEVGQGLLPQCCPARTAVWGVCTLAPSQAPAPSTRAQSKSEGHCRCAGPARAHGGCWLSIEGLIPSRMGKGHPPSWERARPFSPAGQL